MKRFISVLLAAVLMLGLVAAASASSTGKPRFYIEAPSSAKAGDTITVKVQLEGDYTAHILTLHMDYDGSCFEYVSVTRGEVLSAAGEYGMAICEKAPDKPTISVGILYAGDEGLSAVGNVFEAEFKVLKTSASKGEFKLNVAEFGYMPLSAATSTNVDCTVEGATVALNGGGGSQPTTAPTPSPAIPSVTEGAGTTQGADATQGQSATAVPGATESGNSDDPSADNGTTAAPGEPGKTEADSGKSAANEGENSDKNNSENNDNGEDIAHTEPKAELSPGVKAVILAAGVLLAVGLGWLCVHFFKKARAAHNEAANK